MRTLRKTWWCWFLGVLVAGCVSGEVKDQAKITAAAHDVYAKLVESTLDGTISPQDGSPVTAADLRATPKPVRELLQNVVRALYASRRAWHQADFALNDGPDPAKMNLDPPAAIGSAR